MTKRRIYQLMIILSTVSLCGLLIVQVYWFVAAYKMEEKQLNNRISLALRSLANDIAMLNDDFSSKIDIQQIASNAYELKYDHGVTYTAADSLLRKAFVKHNVLIAFELVAYQDGTGQMAFGNLYADGPNADGKALCLERGLSEKSSKQLGIAFPGKQRDIIGGMRIWIFSASIFVLILSLFSVMIFNLSKQKQLAELKADFISNMTHELQTPITNISIASEVLRNGKFKLDGEKSAHYTSIIVAENERLKANVERLLQTSMLEKGELSMKKTEVNVNTLIEEVMETFRLRIQSRGGKLVANFGAVRATVFADAFHLKNILYNLLDNADKYSPVTPEISISTQNSKNGICIAVTDKGIGIKQEAHRRIFDKFYRGVTGNIQNVTGFGLGLTYVKNIVEAHQGNVQVKSNPESGSCFEVHLQNL